jgi:hypothetical protein
MQNFSAQRIASVALPLLLAIAHAPSADAQVRPTSRDTSMKPSSAMPAHAGMPGMMSGPHHALAMAYGENLATFARALNSDASRSNIVSTELARPATAEMRRSFDQMKLHHQSHMSTVGTTMRMPMTKDSAAAMTRPARSDSLTARSMPMPMRTDSARPTKMGDMRAQMATIETHLALLETEVKATTPNAAKVIEHTAEILKVRDSAMRMPADSSRKAGPPDVH